MRFAQSPEVLLDELRLKTGDLLQGDDTFVRVDLLNELITTLPRDPEVRLRVWTVELAPGTDNPWHVHNGVLIVLILQGESVVTFGGASYHHKAGDVFIEPIGIPHRAYNPNPEIPLIAVAFQFTAPDRAPIVELEAPEQVADYTEAPSGVWNLQISPDLD